MRLCKDCIYLEGGIKNTDHTCEAPENDDIDLVTGEAQRRKTPEQMRSAWNSGQRKDCGVEGVWWKARG